MTTLTRRQNDVLRVIKKVIDATGIPPTRAEIALQLGFKSPNAAEEHLRALSRKGVIEILSGASRGIRIVNDQSENNEQDNGLPVIGKVAAGHPVLAQEHIEQYCMIPANFFSPAADYLLRVQGDSMKNAGIIDGDLLAVRKQHTAENGQIVVARMGEEVTVKRLKKMAHQILLLPENDDYEPITVSDQSEDFSVEGIYVGVIRH